MSSEEPEVLDGEVLPAVYTPPSNSNLNARQLQAAIGEAAGMSRRQIAEMVGVTESSIKQWRQKPEYVGEVERVRATYKTALEEPVKKLHEKLINATTDAVAELQHALKAVDKNNRPIWSVRLEAAKLLMQHGIELDKDTRQMLGGAPKGAQAAAGVVQLQVNVNRD